MSGSGGELKRVHVLEFEDLPWFPQWLRNDMTRVIVVLSRFVGVPAILSHHLARVLREQGLTHVVDLGSGAGGVMPEVIAALRTQPGLEETTLTLTDRYPNADVVAQFAGTDAGMAYLSEPVDATDLAAAPPGVKTICNAFHHMRPDQARAILKSARESRQPLVVYELANRTLPFWVWVLALPLALPLVFVICMVLTPFVRPLSLRQVLFTFFIPVIPAFYAWDGQASYPRTYSFADLDALLEGLDGEGYRWEKGPATDGAGRTFGTILIGQPA